MEMRCRCPACQTKFKVDGKYAGKKARCPKCQQIVEVPKENLEATTTSAPAPKAGQPPKPAAAQPAAAPATGFQIQVASKSAAKAVGAKPAETGKTASKAKKLAILPLLIGGGLLALVLVVGGIAAIWALSQPATVARGGATSGGSTAGAVSATTGTLILDWPDADPQQAQLSIDGRREPFAKGSEFKFTLAAGPHKVFILRRGFEPYETEVTLARGVTERIAPAWKAATGLPSTTGAAASSPTVASSSSSSFPIGTAVPLASVRGFDGWLQGLDQAKQRSRRRQQGHPAGLWLLRRAAVNAAARARLQEADAAAAIAPLVRVVIDFPRTAAGHDMVQDSAQNRALLEEFNLDRLPALALADARGRVYALQREWPDGFGDVAQTLAQLQTEQGPARRAAGRRKTGRQ